jgi:AcrR family transcriptional regulator
MSDDSSAKRGRRPRADGERNRLRLIAAANSAMALGGAAVSLEQIARGAGVSIATLYRHFPTRDTLIEAVYRQETDALVDLATQLISHPEPLPALREWLLFFVNFLDTKQGMADVLGTLIGGPDALFNDSSVRLATAIDTLIIPAKERGDLHIDVEPLDLLRAIGGVANINPSKHWKQSAVRMVDLLIAGLKHSH